MALSGSVATSAYTTSSGGTRSVTLKWTATQNITNNTSTISWELVGTGSYDRYVVVSELRVTIDGAQVYYRDSSNHTNCYPNTVLASGSKTITHNGDGSRSFTVKVEAGIYDWAINRSGNNTFTLDTIPRSSTIISADNITLGSTCKIRWTPASSSFKYKLKFSLGNWSYTTSSFIEPKTTNAYTYSGTTISADSNLLSQIPNSTTGTMTVILTTYNSSGTAIGSTSSKTFTVSIPSNIIPAIGTITLTPSAINNNSILIKGKNKLTIAVSGCSAGTGSSIKSYAFSGPSISKTISSTSSSASTSVASVTDVGSFTNEETTLTYTVTVTDQRGRTASKTNTIKCYDYYSPSFGKIDIYRASSDGSANVSGTYIQCDYTEKYASVNSTNSVTVTAYYNDGNTIRTQTGSNGKILINLNGDTSATYRVYLGIDDTYGGSNTSSAVSIFGQFRIFNITSDGTGLAIGKMAESNNLFECRWDAKFNGTASGPSGFSTSSDERVKKNIQDIDVDIVDSLRPIQYELIQSTDGKTHYGFIAQDVEKILYNNELNPETIGLLGHIINNGRQEYVLTYTEFIPLLTKKCQALQAEINMLKQEISELKDAIALLQK